MNIQNTFGELYFQILMLITKNDGPVKLLRCRRSVAWILGPPILKRFSVVYLICSNTGDKVTEIGLTALALPRSLVSWRQWSFVPFHRCDILAIRQIQAGVPCRSATVLQMLLGIFHRNHVPLLKMSLLKILM